MLTLENVSVKYNDHIVVDELSFSLHEGQWLMLVGPNGAGKSTLINAISQGVSYSGNIYLEGKDIRTFKPVKLAQKIGVLSQHNNVSYSYTVEEIVNLGRYAHSSGFMSSRDGEGKEMIDKAILMTGMESFRNSSVLTLSGGELQRAFLAQVFAQDPKILILDEPANHLDLVYQKNIFGLIKEWLKQPGKAVMSVVHDLSLAKRYGTHAILLHNGKCVAKGVTDQVLTSENLNEVYNMDVYEWMHDLFSQWK